MKKVSRKYDKYKAKIQHRAKFFKFVKKFRVLIITVSAAIVATTTGLLVARGTVYGDVLKTDNIMYGEELEFEADAFMGDVSYEYFDYATGVWTTETPTHPGNYKVRAVSKTTFGGKRYSDEHAFTIHKRAVDVTIVEDTIEYGKLPQVQAEMVGEDTLQCVGVRYGNLDDEDRTNDTIEPILQAYNGNGAKVDLYEFHVAEEEKNITLTNRVVTVSTGDYEWTYDGKIHTYTEGTKHSDLAFETDVLTAEYSVSVQNYTKTPVKNLAQFSISNVDGIDITQYYDVRPTFGSLEIKQREITVESVSSDKEYDGTALFAEALTSYDAETINLAEGHKISVVEDTGTRITYAGMIENEVELLIKDADGADVTDNYAINLVKGYLNVSPRKITITSHDAARDYNGMPLTIENAVESNLVERAYTVSWTDAEKTGEPIVDGDGLAITFTTDATITYSGKKKNDFEYSFVNDKAKSSYIVEQKFGTLTITGATIFVNTQNAEKTYDGTPLLAENGYLAGGGLFGENDGEYKLFNGDVLIFDDYTTRIDWSEETVYNIPQTIRIEDGKGNDITDSYVILTPDTDDDETTVWGTLTISKREIIVNTHDCEWVYDGEIHFDGDVNTTAYTETDLFESTLAVTGNDYLVTAPDDTVKFTNVWETLGGVENTTQFRVYRKMESGESEDVSNNYVITHGTKGTLRILPRELSVQAASATYVYNGVEQTIEQNAFVWANGSAMLIEGHILRVSTQMVVGENVGEYTHVIVGDSGVIVDGNGEELQIDGHSVVENYAIAYADGLMTITIRTITVKTNDCEWVYDGKEHYENDGVGEAFGGVYGAENVLSTGADDTLLSMHRLYLDTTAEQTKMTNVKLSGEEVIGEENMVTVYAAYEDGTINTNYKISYEYGTLRITKRQITLLSDAGKWVYDGDVHLAANVEINAGTLAEGQNIFYDNFTSVQLITDGTPNQFTWEITDGTEDVGYNYAVGETYGSLIVTPRKILIERHTFSWVYDGQEHTDNEEYSDADLRYPDNNDELDEFERYYNLAKAQRHVLCTVEDSNNVVKNVVFDENGNVTSVANEIRLAVYYGDQDVSSNYQIEYVEDLGTLTVTRRPLSVSTHSHTFIYNGTEQGCIDDMDINLLLKIYLGESITFEDIQNFSNTCFGKYNLHYSSLADQIGLGDFYEFDENNSLAATEFLVVKDSTKITNVAEGKIKNNVTFDIQTLAGANFVSTLSNYNLTVVDDGYLEVNPLEITIESDGDEKEYDGTPLTMSAEEHSLGVTSNFLSALHKIANVNYTNSITDAGWIENEFTFEILDIATGEPVPYEIVGVDSNGVIGNYKVNIVNGILEVTPREIYIVAGTDVHELDLELIKGGATYGFGTIETLYMGAEIVSQEAGKYWMMHRNGELVPALAERDSIRVTTSGLKTPNGDIAIDVGDYTHYIETIEIYWVDEFGAEIDKRDNYAIVIVDRNVTITPRILAIRTNDCEFTYNGRMQKDETKYTPDNIVAESTHKLVEGHQIVQWEYTYITNVDESGKDNDVRFKILDADGNNMSDRGNYITDTTLLGTMTMSPAELQIKTHTHSFTYNGLDQGNCDENGCGGYGDGADCIISINGESGSLYPREWEMSAFKQQYFKVASYTSVKDVKQGVLVNETTLTIVEEDGSSSVWVSIFVGSEEVLKECYYDNNYVISYPELGTLQITPREITVNMHDLAWEYDGERHYDDSEYTQEDLIDGTTLVDGEWLEIDALNDENYLVNVWETRDNRSTFRLYRWGEEGREEITENYVVNYADNVAALTVIPREISVQAASDTYVYNAETQRVNGFIIVDGILIDGHYLQVETENCEGIDAGRYVHAIVQNSGVVVDGSGEEILIDGHSVTENYAITYFDGEMVIRQRELYIQTNDCTWMYDGEEHYEGDGIGENFGGEYTAENVLPFGEENTLLTSFGHQLILDAVAPSARITNVLESYVSNEVTVYVAYEDGTRNDNYIIVDYVYGNLEVTPRPITIISVDGEWVYDRTEHTANGILVSEESEYSLVGEHTLYAWNYKSVKDATDGTNNTYSWLIRENEDSWTSVNSNYAVTEEYGTLIVYPRRIQINTHSIEWMYDGDKHYDGDAYEKVVYNFSGEAEQLNQDYVAKYNNDDLTDTSMDDTLHISERYYKLLDGDKLQTLTKTKDRPTITNVTPNGVENRLAFTVSCQQGDANNYLIEFAYGKLMITPRPIMIEPKSNTNYIYNGKDLTIADGNYSVMSGVITQNGEWKEYFPLIAGQEILVSSQGVTIAAHDVYIKDDPLHQTKGYTKFLQQDAKVIDADGQDITANYTISYRIDEATGELKQGVAWINPRSITITTHSWEMEYDGEYHDESEFYPNGYDNSAVTKGSLVNNQQLLLDSELNRLLNANDYESKELRKNILQFKISDEIFGDVTYCYNITIDAGIMTITRRPIVVKTHTHAWTYDGESHSCTNDCLNGGYTQEDIVGEKKLVADHYFVVKTATELTDTTWNVLLEQYDTVKNELKLAVYDGDVETKNYIISYAEEAGSLTMLRRDLYLKSASAEKTYDGTDLIKHEIERESVVGLLSSHGLVPTFTGKQRYAYTLDEAENATSASSANTFTVEISTEMVDSFATHNYNIHYEYGTLTVFKRAITFKSRDLNEVYNGKEQFNKNLDIINEAENEGLATKTDAYVVTEYTKVTDVCENVKNDYTVVIKNRNVVVDEHCEKNYLITKEYGSLTITPRPITVIAHSDSREYNGEEQVLLGGYMQIAEVDNIVAGHMLYATVSDASGIEPGIYQNAFLNDMKFDVYCGEEKIKSENYRPEFLVGTLTITKISLEIETWGNEWTYDGNYHEELGYTDNGKVLPVHTLSVVNSTKVRDYRNGGYDNVLTFVIKDANEEPVLEKYYDVTYVCGTLYIHKKTLHVTTGSAEKVYDGTPLICEECWLVESEIVSGEEHNLITTGKQKDAGESPNTFSLEIWRINELGEREYTTNNYEFDADGSLGISSLGTLKVTKKKIVITTDDITFDYNGTEQGDNREYTTYPDEAGEGVIYVPAVEGHIVKGKPTSFVKDKGDEADNNVTFEIYDENGKPVTDNYEIEVDPGKLSVAEQNLGIIKTHDIIWQYDGAAHYDGDGVEPVMVDGTYKTYLNGVYYHENLGVDDYFVIDREKEYAKITEIGSTENVLSLKIMRQNADGTIENVTHCYSFTYQYGTLTVQKRDVEINPETINAIYNGQTLTTNLSLYNADGLLSGHKFVITDETVANTEYELSDALSIEELQNKYAADACVNVINTTSDFGIEFTYPTAVTDGGAWDIVDANGNSVKDYYNAPSFGYGSLSFEKRSVLICPQSKAVTYNGKEQEIFADSTYVTYYGLVDGHYLDSENNDFTSGAKGVLPGKYAHTFIVNEDGIVILNVSGRDVSEFYQIELDNNERYLTINKRNITIASGSKTKYYNENDTTPLTYNNVTWTANALLENHKIEYTTTGMQVGVGSSENTFTYTFYEQNENGEWIEGDITDYYNVTEVEGTLTIKEIRHQLIIRPKDIVRHASVSTSLQHTGEIIDCGNGDEEFLTSVWALQQSGYMIIPTITVAENADGKSATARITDVVIYDADGNDVTALFAVNHSRTGEIEIIEHNYIYIELQSVSYEYDGNWHSYEANSSWRVVESKSKCSAEYLSGVNLRIDMIGRTDVGVVSDADLRRCVTINGKSLNNYTDVYVEFSAARLQVLPKAITVTSNSDSATQNECTELTNNGFKHDGLLEGHGIEVTITGKQVGVGLSKNTIESVKITDADGNDVTRNYNITLIEGDLRIWP
ncbi:MAG: hypothetical protein IJV83_02235 [Clostridia bacterium]|nr:hypothetical protein [Clostridia bacterium]